jgi:hypothetical protein
MAKAGMAFCFFLNGVSFLAVIAGLLMMRLPVHARPVDGETAWQQALSGFGYVEFDWGPQNFERLSNNVFCFFISSQPKEWGVSPSGACHLVHSQSIFQSSLAFGACILPRGPLPHAFMGRHRVVSDFENCVA